MKITSIKISKLWGIKSYNIKIKDNRLIIVGENGSGKSTILKLIYLFLSKQWTRMKEIQFESIEVEIDSNSYLYNNNEEKEKLTEQDAIRFLEKNPKIFNNIIIELYDVLKENGYFDKKKDNILGNLTVSGRLSHIFNMIGIDNLSAIKPDPERISEPLYIDFIQKVSEIHFSDDQYSYDIPVLFLPTYRRTELEFTKFLPLYMNLSVTKDESKDLLSQVVEQFQRLKRMQLEKKKGDCIELAEFGLEDVFQNLESFFWKENI